MFSTPRRRIVVLISGSGASQFVNHSEINAEKEPEGTNLQALIDAAILGSEIVLVLSNRKNAYGLIRAANASPPIPTTYLALQPYLKSNPEKTRADYDVEVAQIVLSAKPDIVVLAGWMHIFGDSFLELLDGRKALDGEGELVSIPVINLHPALPGAFDGANALQRAYEAFQRGEIDRSGVMVHRVVKDVDQGEPIVVREVPMEKDESINQFEERLHAVEHEIIVEATRRVLDEVKPLAA
ncbi:hypothetical protein AX15_002445 [Amanita polypyramis BW_CC]|nr:hypothetical protein AX15_002445 [Amanita polypyramis BW_CC]